ncbi:hypothetical protein VTJ04DRAFT_9164 [Mycothermus thermophilus]|uniref:uncharacterized protein n=1 Tax=Humicola insolens TaxID=85995 RepID=UPI00374230D2
MNGRFCAFRWRGKSWKTGLGYGGGSNCNDVTIVGREDGLLAGTRDLGMAWEAGPATRPLRALVAFDMGPDPADLSLRVGL